MAFIAKHLPEKFTIINGQRINLRDNLFREIVGNLLVHREFTNPFPAKLVIEANQVRTENWNKPHGTGAIDPANFSPYPKNPIIAKFFKEIGWVDELGSGVRNTFKYLELYHPGAVPLFKEGDVFEIVIPIEGETVEETKKKGSEKSSEKGSEKSSEKIIRLLKDENDLSAKDLAKHIGITERAVEKQIANLKLKGKLNRIGPDKGGYWEVIEK